MKILVIEDETILRDEVVEWLTLEGYDALGMADGLAGIQEAFQNPPDLIICDITMPHLDGHGVLLELRANPSTATIPLIFVTARASYEDMRQGMVLGADDYITKPFTRLELLQSVQARLERKLIQDQQHELTVLQWQRAFEQEREQRLLKSKLVAMFSHDFRNPLTSIMFSNSTLREHFDQLDPERRKKHFNRVEASARQLLQMLEDLLVISQLETGNLELDPELLNIDDLLRQFVEETQVIHSHNVQLIYESQFRQPIMADPRLVRQIASNLISNAIKYSPKASEVRVILQGDDQTVTLTVQDQGMGIPKAEQSKLFVAFQRASNTGTIAGTGLGLAIVKQAVELHHGSIQLESELGVGTTITVTFPVKGIG